MPFQVGQPLPESRGECESDYREKVHIIIRALDTEHDDDDDDDEVKTARWDRLNHFNPKYTQSITTKFENHSDRQLVYSKRLNKSLKDKSIFVYVD